MIDALAGNMTFRMYDALFTTAVCVLLMYYAVRAVKKHEGAKKVLFVALSSAFGIGAVFYFINAILALLLITLG